MIVAAGKSVGTRAPGQSGLVASAGRFFCLTSVRCLIQSVCSSLPRYRTHPSPGTGSEGVRLRCQGGMAGDFTPPPRVWASSSAWTPLFKQSKPHCQVVPNNKSGATNPAAEHLPILSYPGSRFQSRNDPGKLETDSSRPKSPQP